MCIVDTVTVSIEETFYSITQPEDSVEICINATEGSLDETVTVNLQTQRAFYVYIHVSAIMLFFPYKDDTVELTLSPTVTRTCSNFTFLNSLFSRNGRIETIHAVIVSDNRRVTFDQFLTEVALFNGSGGKLINSHDHCITTL